MQNKLRVIVGGVIGLYSTGGATWDYLQFPLGLKLMGHDVYYIEDTMRYPHNANKKKWDEHSWTDATECIEYLKRSMAIFDLSDRWAYRDYGSGKCFGMSLKKVKDLCKTADVFINISASSVLRDEYLKIPSRIFIDSDPMFTQIQSLIPPLHKIKNSMKEMVEAHNHLFSFGENIGNRNCRIPTLDKNWLPLRQPICLDYWENGTGKTKFSFTSVMNWNEQKQLMFANEAWGQKDVEFQKFLGLPAFFPNIKFEIVINPPVDRKHPTQRKSKFDKSRVQASGWRVLNPKKYIATSEEYKKFIQHSYAEFSVAKETYVKSNSGWFSCRSACYLAAGKPVVTQDTGWSNFIPSGQGLFAFTNLQTAKDAIEEVTGNYKQHTKAAKDIAREYFDSSKVLSQLLCNIN